MTEAYGFNHLYSSLDYLTEMDDKEDHGFLTDGMIFKYASYKDDATPQPFFSLILTMSMHQPYESFEKHGFEVAASCGTYKTSVSEKLNFEDALRHADEQMYIEKQKSRKTE